MSYLVLARKWRPQTFEEVVGQEHVTRTLTNAIRKQRIAHAYLFAGPRGVGKTTTARLLAKALNCAEGPTVTPCNKCASCAEIAQSGSLDVLEIDGASNRRIEEVRSIRENVKFAPGRDRYKIYIIDEVHMLTTEAFNALLKTLEEPPEHVKFIFATTAPRKVLPTILSRCQRFDFRRLEIPELVQRLTYIAKEEKVKIEEKAFYAMARGVEGSMRDALSLLDQLIAFSEGKITAQEVNAVLGMVDEEISFSLIDALLAGDTLSGIRIIDQVITQGKDLYLFATNLIEHFRNMLMLKIGPEALELVDLPEDSLKRLGAQAEYFELEDIETAIKILAQTAEALKWAESGRIPLELAIIKLTKLHAEEAGTLPKPPKPASSEKKITPQAPEEKVTTPKKEATHLKKPSGAKTSSIEKIKEKWTHILSEIKSRKISTEAFLREGEPLEVDEETLTVGFPEEFKFHKETIERKEIRALIREVLRETLGHDLGVKVVIDKSLVPRKRKAHPEKVLKNAPASKEASEDPLTQAALDVFGARIIETKELL